MLKVWVLTSEVDGEHAVALYADEERAVNALGDLVASVDGTVDDVVYHGDGVYVADLGDFSARLIEQDVE